MIRDYKDRICISLPSLLHELYHVPWFQLAPLFVEFTVYLFNLDRYHELQYHISNCLQGISTWELADHCKLTRIYYYQPTNLLLLHLLKRKKKKHPNLPFMYFSIGNLLYKHSKSSANFSWVFVFLINSLISICTYPHLPHWVVMIILNYFIHLFSLLFSLFTISPKS